MNTLILSKPTQPWSHWLFHFQTHIYVVIGSLSKIKIKILQIEIEELEMEFQKEKGMSSKMKTEKMSLENYLNFVLSNKQINLTVNFLNQVISHFALSSS